MKRAITLEKVAPDGMAAPGSLGYPGHRKTHGRRTPGRHRRPPGPAAPRHAPDRLLNASYGARDGLHREEIMTLTAWARSRG